jgi:large subunit ribosomal protein L3
MKFIIGKKIEMTQRFGDDGRVVPVTLIQAGPCVVTQVKDATRDGYRAVQIGFGHSKHITKSITGHLKDTGSFEVLREFRVPEGDSLEYGATIQAGVFEPGDIVKVVATSKGRGFQGVVKRHGFKGSPATHGHKDQLRMPGSIGSKRQGPVAKGKRMPGRMGGERITVTNLKVVDIDAKTNQLAVRGAVPGARGSLVLIQSM